VPVEHELGREIEQKKNDRIFELHFCCSFFFACSQPIEFGGYFQFFRPLQATATCNRKLQ